MNPARRRQRTGQEVVGSAMSDGEPVAVALHLSTCCVLKESIGIMIVKLVLESHVREMVAAEFARDDGNQTVSTTRCRWASRLASLINH